MKTVGIIGAGPSGIMAALSAHDNGAEVTLFEKKDKIGKKILATGNGRCNFTNLNMSSDNYYCDNPEIVSNVLKRFGNNDLIRFFTGLGMLIKDKNGYIYPASEQASTVLDVLRATLREKNINIVTESEISEIKKTSNGYSLKANNKEYKFDSVIVATGGKAGLSPKETANGYDLVKPLGHKSSRLYPALTQIFCNGLNFKAVSGVRNDCILYCFSDDELLMTMNGELLFTDKGISGIVSFQISHCVAEAVAKKEKVVCIIDLLPGFSEEDIKAFVTSKYLLHPDITIEEFFCGILNKKLNNEFIKNNGFKNNSIVSSYPVDALVETVLSMKELIVECTGVNDFEHAQVTGGGINPEELSCDFESLNNKGLYIVGELLNVDGICGGYNLQWAFSTGYIAGKAAAVN